MVTAQYDARLAGRTGANGEIAYMRERAILHVDMDAFFASVEELTNPELHGKPVIVGGGVSRGVVSAASYAARAFGVHSAMPMAQAMRLCPHAVVIPPHMDLYRTSSRRVMAILSTYTPLLEQVSVDEAYLDMTNWLPPGTDSERIAREIQQRIAAETGLTCSLGVATGKAIAKMASDLRKPNGLVMVTAGSEAAFLAPLAIGQLRGVGEATERKLRGYGVQTIGDLAALQESFLTRHFGVHGRDLHALARGIDDSPVIPEHQAKSIGRETTFLTDINDRHTLEVTLLELTEDVAESLRRHEMLARGVTLKIRYDDFSTRTRAHTLPEPLAVTGPLYQQALALLREVNPFRPVRLIGVTAGPLLPSADRQLSLFSEPAVEKDRRIDRALDAVRARFGDDAIIRARLADGHSKPRPTE